MCVPWDYFELKQYFLFSQFEVLYGKKAAALYTQAGDYQKTARFYYKKAEDTYYQVSFVTCSNCSRRVSA